MVVAKAAKKFVMIAGKLHSHFEKRLMYATS
jgi:hypothetical protein